MPSNKIIAVVNLISFFFCNWRNNAITQRKDSVIACSGAVQPVYDIQVKQTQFNLVAEIGCNHKGDFAIAKNLIKSAKDCGVSYVKFQKRTVRELLTPEQFNSPHPELHQSYGSTYGSHREYLEFSIEKHFELKKYAESLNMVWSISVWDTYAARQVITLKPDYIKVPSACNLNQDLLKILRDEYQGDVHISLGMTSKAEQSAIVSFFELARQSHRLILYACTSNYPTAFEDVCLLEIKNLIEKFSPVIKAVGFSGHHLGIAMDIAAATLGATWIERHFTLDRTWKGTDHAASLEPSGLGKLARDLNALAKSLTYKSSDILAEEKPQFQKLKTIKTLL